MKKHLLSLLLAQVFILNAFAHGGGHCGGHGGHGHCGGHGHGVYFGYSGAMSAFDYLPHYGTAQLDNGEVLQGEFKYSWFNFPTYNFKYYTTQGITQRLYWMQVNKMVLAGADTNLSYRNDSTEFYRLNYCTGFYRKLTNGRINVYDGLVNVNEAPGLVSYNDIVIVYQGTQRRFYSIADFNRFVEDVIPAYYAEMHPKKKRRSPIIVAQLFAAINSYNNEG